MFWIPVIRSASKLTKDIGEGRAANYPCHCVWQLDFI